MGKSAYLAAIIVLAFILSGCVSMENQLNTPFPVQEQAKINKAAPVTAPVEEYIKLVFIEPKTNCGFEGDLILNNETLAGIKNNSFKLTPNVYNLYKLPQNTLCVKGTLSDCNYTGWIIHEHCWSMNLTGDNFGVQTVSFNLTFNPKKPQQEEMSNFVRPEDVRWYLNSIKMPGDLISDIGRIQARMNTKKYILDINSERLPDYWKLPNETLNSMQCDCEDWGTAFLSLVKAYNSSLKCYSLLMPSHVTTFCKFGELYKLMDRENDYGSSIDSDGLILDRKYEFRKWLDKYYTDYGITPKYRKVNAAFDDRNYIEFESNDEFAEWALKL